MKTRQKEYFYLYILFFLIALGVYHTGLRVPYFGDDFQLVFANPRDAIFHDFFHQNPINLFYRPIQTMLLGLFQTYLGWETLPIRLVNLLFHAGTTLIIYHALRYWKQSLTASFAATIFFLVAQSAVAAVEGNDTMSQVMGTFFSVASLWGLYRYYSDAAEHRSKPTLFISLALFFLAVLSKETSVGLVFAVPFILFILDRKGTLIDRSKRVILKSLPYAGCFIIYLVLRFNAAAANPTSGNGTYEFAFGFNLIKNAVLFSVQALLPVSSVAVLKSFHYHEYIVLAGIVLFTIAFIGALIYGLWKSSQRGIVATLIVLSICSLFPVFLMALVGEIYVGNTTPYIAALAGLSFGYYYETVRMRSRIVFRSIALLGIAVIVSNAIATDSKVSAMKSLGDKAAILMPQAVEAAKTMPTNAILYLVNPRVEYYDYSLYSLRGFRPISSADTVIRTLARRPDIHVFIGDSNVCAEVAKTYPGVAFTLDTLTWKAYPMNADFGLGFPGKTRAAAVQPPRLQ
ncbi:MAG TPA: glycosyltransferase family 39 protein [Candidatus Kapabacteria bacterium]|nr:glycosyltransferase family 39 protein [Candidatus Kapabacteria bacterium]